MSEAIERLAERPHSKMEHLEPTTNALSWNRLDDHSKEFYRTCVEELMLYPDLVRQALNATTVADGRD